MCEFHVLCLNGYNNNIPLCVILTCWTYYAHQRVLITSQAISHNKSEINIENLVCFREGQWECMCVNRGPDLIITQGPVNHPVWRLQQYRTEILWYNQQLQTQNDHVEHLHLVSGQYVAVWSMLVIDSVEKHRWFALKQISASSFSLRCLCGCNITTSSISVWVHGHLPTMASPNFRRQGCCELIGQPFPYQDGWEIKVWTKGWTVN